MTQCRLVSVGAILIAVGAASTAAGDAPDPLPAPTPERAFATIGGKRYAPFYGYVITPHAVVTGGTVYCAYQNERGRPMAAAYGIAAKTWAGPVQASSFGLGSDAHGNPSLYLDRKGHLHLFYGCHGRAMRHTRSRRPHDIRQWDEQPSPTPRATYPQSMRLADGRVCLFYRAGGHMEPWTMRTSSDDCKTWSQPQRIIEMRLKPRDRLAAAYCDFFPGRDGRTIHCFWNHKDDNAHRVNIGRMAKHPWRPLKYRGLHEAVYRYNIYYVRRDADGKWRSAAGEAVATPISKAVADARCRVHDSGDLFAYPSRLAVDAADRPYVKFSTGIRDWTTGKVVVPMKAKHAAFRDGRWQVTGELPADWPAEAKRVIAARGLAAYGGADAAGWFIFYRRLKPGGSGIYLYHDKTGYAARKGAPTKK